MEMKGARIVIETLIEQGVDTIFGYPGGTVVNLYEELYNCSDRIHHVLTSHEQGAAHAADGYARVTGKVGVVLATSGPGATNLVTGIANAYLDSSPIVAITGKVALAMIGQDSFQDVDIAGMTMPITKHNYLVERIEDLADTLREAFVIAKSGRPGPVLVDVPKDIQLAKYDFEPQSPVPAAPNKPPREKELEQAVKLIESAKRPCIYMGGGVVLSGASKELSDFAQYIDAPISSSMMGLSAISRSNPRFLGMIGMHGNYSATKAIAEADLIVAVGTRFSDRTTGSKDKFAKKAKILHIDIDPAEIGKNISISASVTGDIKDVLTALMRQMNAAEHPDWRKLVQKFKNDEKRLCQFPTNRLHPYAVISKLQALADDNTAIVTDVGQHQMWTAQRYDFAKPRNFVTSGGLGAMGFGMGAAIGSCFGKQKKKTVLITGDGSFHMNLNELATAVTHNLPIVIVVMNNGVLGMVRQWQTLFYDGHYSQTTLDRKTDYVKLAEAFGAAGMRISSLDEMDAVLEAAYACDGPVIVDCIIDTDEMVLPMIPPGGSVDNIILK
ncbi:MAG TPA: biosynthetic-type acetolactate synthase large subunit [Oscillospiraceae bacterium]|nr:biosynthetic-type acetolactate synthase large subunit [Oscillospiraceae bacterium]HPF56412.1 biosynthetic-type acetolactate synthase large subunit [Clostridiales bacterium]HPK36172.1 biosynthetic-type acetolactate synthase large subunit [Oscillospiraceae bacterium]HPR76210.1 biosynthetic-type acetolactate synthase large subunit [Oscillospiraceae bacterium]